MSDAGPEHIVMFLAGNHAGATAWEYLVDEDVDAACDVAVKFCGHFFEVAPKLLKGIEMDKISEPVCHQETR